MTVAKTPQEGTAIRRAIITAKSKLRPKATPMTTNKLIVRAKYPRALPASELEGLAVSLRAAFPEGQVEVDDSADENRVAMSFPEIVHIFLPAGVAGAAGGWILKVVQDVVIEWAKKRFVDKKHKRPKKILLFGPAGEVLSTIKVEDPNSDAQITKDDI